MAYIKRGTTPTLAVQIDGIKPEMVQSVEFTFKLRLAEQEPEILGKIYPGVVSYDAAEGRWLVPFTEAETRLFRPRSDVYMDTRITLSDGTIPTTELAHFCVEETLFEAVGE